MHDRIFVPRTYHSRANWPRIIVRTTVRALDRPPQFSLILKRHIEDSGVDIFNETVVRNYEEATAIILQLGFEQRGEFIKYRQRADWEDIQIYLDEIDGQKFVKLEAELKESEKVRDLRALLVVRAQELGLSGEIDVPYFELFSSTH